MAEYLKAAELEPGVTMRFGNDTSGVTYEIVERHTENGDEMIRCVRNEPGTDPKPFELYVVDHQFVRCDPPTKTLFGEDELAARYREHVDEYLPMSLDELDENGDHPGLDPHHYDRTGSILAKPYMLVERHRNYGIWITRWEDLDKAGNYHTNQEYAEDWAFEALIDLRTDARYELRPWYKITRIEVG